MKRLLVIALCFTVILGISSTAYSQEEKVKSTMERQAWVDTVLANPAGPDIEAYLACRFNGDG